MLPRRQIARLHWPSKISIRQLSRHQSFFTGTRDRHGLGCPGITIVLYLANDEAHAELEAYVGAGNFDNGIVEPPNGLRELDSVTFVRIVLTTPGNPSWGGPEGPEKQTTRTLTQVRSGPCPS